MFNIASTHDKANEYEEACYHYAIALNAGYNEHICRERIISLWTNHGPFKFEKQYEDAKASCRYESCSEGSHLLLIKDINNIVQDSNISS